jgi:NAD(P)-dependent dehydrogenase (short-subunit alcohol dehydrogenase family)
VSAWLISWTWPDGVVVTGASPGIGASTAQRLHAAGARPVLAARRESFDIPHGPEPGLAQIPA